MKATLLAILLALALAAPAQAASMRAENLRVDYQTDPTGIDDRTPSLSWQLTSNEPSRAQQAYQVRVSEHPAGHAGGHVLWDSGKVSSADSVGVSYDGPALASRQKLYWSVRVWDGQGGPSPWAKPASWEMGLLERGDWRGRWIADPESIEKKTEPLVIRFPARTARFLRMDVTRLGLPLQEGWPDPVSRLQFAEIEAYGGGQLRSRGAGVTASESYTVGGVWEPRWLTDGTLDSNRDPRGYTSFERHGQDTSDRPIWLQIDLGQMTSIDELRLYPRTDTLTPERRTANFPEDFTLSSRTDAAGAWERVPPRHGPGGPAAAAADRGHAAAGARLRARPSRSAARGCTRPGSASSSRG